jgi:hypothetical protein
LNRYSHQPQLIIQYVLDRGHNPAIAASGNNVYVVWNDNNGTIQYVRSIINGVSFDPILNLGNGNTPAITASGSNVM